MPSVCLFIGPAKKTRVPDEETNQITAYHEAGHAMVAMFTKDATPLNKVTIIPRGHSLGLVSLQERPGIGEVRELENGQGKTN